MRGKAFGAGTQFSVGGRIELLKSGEELNKPIVRKMGMRGREFDPRSQNTDVLIIRDWWKVKRDRREGAGLLG